MGGDGKRKSGRQRSHARGTPTSDEAAKLTPPDAPLVLLIDDAADNREMYAEYLGFAGFRIQVASSGFEALEALEVMLPAVVVLDVQMPFMDGFEVARRMRARAATARVPILILSADAIEERRDLAREVGCDRFLAKPCLPSQLAEAINSLLGLAEPPAK